MLNNKKKFFFNILNESFSKKDNLNNYGHLQPVSYYLKNKKFFKKYWTHDLMIYNKIFYLKKNLKNLNKEKKNLNNTFFKHFNSICLLTLTRFYCHIGDQKNKLNNFWRGFILGNYYNINIINLNISLVVFKLILNIFSKIFYKFFEVSKVLIFSSKVKKDSLFRLGAGFGNHYYFSKWVFGLLTNKTLWWKKRKKFKKKKPRIFLKRGGLPILGFFTDFELVSQREFILSEFNKFSIPTFTISDTTLHISYETYMCPLNAKNKYSIHFYLLILSKLMLQNKLFKNLYWLWSLNNILIKMFLFKKLKKKRFKKRRKKWRRKPFFTWNHNKVIREHYKAVDEIKEIYRKIFNKYG